MRTVLTDCRKTSAHELDPVRHLVVKSHVSKCRSVRPIRFPMTISFRPPSCALYVKRRVHQIEGESHGLGEASNVETPGSSELQPLRRDKILTLGDT